MMDECELCAQVPGLRIETLRAWIEAGLVQPSSPHEPQAFDDADVARAALLNDLNVNLGVDHGALPIVAALIDQLHTTRHSLRALTSAILEQPDEIQIAIRTRAHIVMTAAPAKRR